MKTDSSRTRRLSKEELPLQGSSSNDLYVSQTEIRHSKNWRGIADVLKDNRYNGFVRGRRRGFRDGATLPRSPWECVLRSFRPAMHGFEPSVRGDPPTWRCSASLNVLHRHWKNSVRTGFICEDRHLDIFTKRAGYTASRL
ncbi:unnamed protein product [Phytophthora fragariaefolia]|uniref:Unnamed protein product n=1 Tax=Phytophthora fragariaefolia TaxID=1490495 RepID=A0A9W7CXH1_9STRA|nr:unnamed protein product [Phytophthora fragariaefolia]